jgi:hypothetical protein
MFDIGKQDEQPARQTIQLASEAENGTCVRIYLDLLYSIPSPFNLPKATSKDRVNVIRFLQKYECHSLLHTIRLTLRDKQARRDDNLSTKQSLLLAANLGDVEACSKIVRETGVSKTTTTPYIPGVGAWAVDISILNPASWPSPYVELMPSPFLVAYWRSYSLHCHGKEYNIDNRNAMAVEFKRIMQVVSKADGDGWSELMQTPQT